jgi:hypothetical protein
MRFAPPLRLLAGLIAGRLAEGFGVLERAFAAADRHQRPTRPRHIVTAKATDAAGNMSARATCARCGAKTGGACFKRSGR